MLKKLYDWILSLFGKMEAGAPPPVQETFTGWVKDDVDARDHIFKGDQK